VELISFLGGKGLCMYIGMVYCNAVHAIAYVKVWKVCCSKNNTFYLKCYFFSFGLSYLRIVNCIVISIYYDILEQLGDEDKRLYNYQTCWY